MIKKSAGILLFVLFLFMTLTAGTVSAFIDTDKTVYEEAVNLLEDLGIVTGMTSDYYMPGEKVTRAEAATILARLTGMPFEGKKSDVFADVPAEHWANSAVTLCHELDIIHGMDETHFMPEDAVSLAQLAKMLVSFAGYVPAAEAAGGYPAGYLMKAAQLEILSDTEGECTRGEMARMVYKTLFVPVFQPTAYGDDGGKYEAGKTVLEYYLHIQKKSGIVTADNFNCMNGDAFAKPGEIHIDGEVYAFENAENAKLFGKKITFYVREDINDALLILSANVSKNVTTVQIKADELLPETTKASVYFARGTQKSERVDILQDAHLIKNGAEIIGWSEKDLQIQTGTIELIQNNGTSADIIVIQTYENFVVDSISAYTGAASLKDDADSINLTEGEEYEHIYIFDSDGKAVEASSLKEWNVLSVYASLDKSILRVVVSARSIVGKIEEISSDNSITVSGTKYAADAALTPKLQVGQNAEFYLDHEGRLAAFNEQSTSDALYAYLLAAELGKGMNARVRMKMMTEKGTIQTFTLAEKIELGAYSVKANMLFNKSELSDGVRNEVNALFSGEEIHPQLIMFRLNEAEEISSIHTAQDGTAMNADERESIFSLDAVEDTNMQFINAGMLCMLGTRYHVADTLIFNVAETYNETNKDLFSVKTVSSLTHGNDYKNMEVYDLDALNRPAVILRVVESANENSRYSAKAGLVTEIGEGMTADGLVCKTIKVVGKNNAKEETFYNVDDVEATYKASVLSDPKVDALAEDGVLPDTIKHADIAPGDILKIEANSQNEIITMAVLVRAESPKVDEKAYYSEAVRRPAKNKDYHNAVWIYAQVDEAENGIYKYFNTAPSTPYERVHTYNKNTLIFEWDKKEKKARQITGSDIEKGDMLASSRGISNEWLIVVYR